jgi:hypothetical protein
MADTLGALWRASCPFAPLEPREYDGDAERRTLSPLEGNTGYTLDFEPKPYWMAAADAVLHRIHRRVLDHVKMKADAVGT